MSENEEIKPESTEPTDDQKTTEDAESGNSDKDEEALEVDDNAFIQSKAPESDDLKAVEMLQEAQYKVLTELKRIIVGQQEVLDQIMIAMLAKGHCLLVGVPGLAKTLMINSLAKVLELNFARVQFTPDLMPSDITGTEVLQENKATGERVLKFIPGPVFTNILLADEINRTPPKTQAALLEAMQEYHVTTGGVSREITQPFFVLATQNPIEQEGTYPLPEAQLDRFMFFIKVDYPSEDEELEIVRRTTGAVEVELQRALTGEDIMRLQKLVRRVPVADHVIRFAMTLVRKSRPGRGQAPGFVDECVVWGAGPRASQYLILGAKARAALQGRFAATTDDVIAVAKPTLRHRIITNFNAEAEGITSDIIIDRLIKEVPRSQGKEVTSDKVPDVLG